MKPLLHGNVYQNMLNWVVGHMTQAVLARKTPHTGSAIAIPPVQLIEIYVDQLLHQLPAAPALYHLDLNKQRTEFSHALMSHSFSRHQPNHRRNQEVGH